MKVAAVVPAYNESQRISTVLDTLAAAPSLDEIIIVDDGSLDGTADIVRQHSLLTTDRARLIVHTPNQGKGAAMRTGADSTDADVIVFFDADLMGLTPTHVEDLVAPVKSGKVAMSLGVFRGGRGLTTIAQILAPNISGQRAIRREVFLAIPCLSKAGYGVELAITNYVLGEGLPIARVVLKDVTHPMKEEKLGFFRGTYSRLRMYRQIFPYLIKRQVRKRRGGAPRA